MSAPAHQGPRFDVRFASPLVRVLDSYCDAAPGSYGAETCVRSWYLLFQHAGVFVKRGTRGTVVADPGQVLFFNRGEAFQLKRPAPGGDRSTLLEFSPEVVREAVAEWDPSASQSELPFRASHATAEPALLLERAALLPRLRSTGPSALEVEEAALRLLRASLAQCYRPRRAEARPPSRRTRQARRELVAATRLLLAGEPGACPTLASLGRCVGSSPFHLARAFREEVGLTVHQYLIHLRLALAVERLAHGARDLTGLALELGFSSHSHFTRLFSRTFGVPPARFRQASAAGNVAAWPVG